MSYYSVNRKHLLNYQKEYNQKQLRLYPWKSSYLHAQRRCKDINNERFKDYGGRGIEFYLTMEEIKELWFRYKSYLMKKPSIDRIDNDGHYTLDNCRFIEHAENSAKDKRFSVLQYDLKGNFIREYSSISEAGLSLKIPKSSISNTCNRIYKQTHGYIFEFKEGYRVHK